MAIDVMTSDSPGASLLYVSCASEGRARGGREILSQLLFDAVHGLAGNALVKFEVPRRNSLTLTASIRSVFTGHVDGVSSEVNERIVRLIDTHAIQSVFIDGSNLGAVAAAIRKARSHVRVCVFFHNCEARFFLGAFRQEPRPHTLGVLLANYFAERSAVRNSDKRICLNQRDSKLLVSMYGHGATDISPMAMKDRFQGGGGAASESTQVPYALFVGGNFYANRHGIEWFVDNVASKSPLRTVVVGNGFDGMKGRLERNGNVEVIGGVDDLAPWYLGASVVIAPIFDGSGMKTKVAEALMYGKQVIGTPEAFVGYEAVAADVGVVCSTHAEFLAALAGIGDGPPHVDPHLRGIYLQRYSYDAAKAKLAAILTA